MISLFHFSPGKAILTTTMPKVTFREKSKIAKILQDSYRDPGGGDGGVVVLVRREGEGGRGHDEEGDAEDGVHAN